VGARAGRCPEHVELDDLTAARGRRDAVRHNGSALAQHLDASRPLDAEPQGDRAGGILGRDLISSSGSAATYGFDPTRSCAPNRLEVELYVLAARRRGRAPGRARSGARSRMIVGELAAALKRGR
jgi:hypothetical protein